MAEKDDQPLQAETYDLESASSADHESNAKELQHKKRMRRLGGVTAIVVLLTVVILVFPQTVMRIKGPELRIRSVAIEDLTISNSDTNSPSLSMKFDSEIGVKNTNFGEFKFDESSITFVYKGTEVGDASVEKGKAKARSTKKMNVTAEVNANSNLANDVRSGFLTLTSQSKLNGKVHLMKVIKKKKTAEMNCTITINLENKVVQDFKCKSNSN
ncbi:hypothetical protein L484_014210 [Morus notabilis]|uniref:Late embryogenesis abundant protein LEA-2 subgroup domain-containing protein n=1 Tax=Morus notabilis TaxID=981085 RepID=W9S2W1_9ROSA|nr:late embryogenesis abundant protein At1g64065 [Morus notabilis]EXC05942.1 hypothetical protein L484_014210 [Morus notabilis]